jgi:hypothetical protein
MKISIPCPQAQQIVPLLCDLLKTGTAVYSPGKVFLPGDRPRSLTIESRSGALFLGSSVPLQVWYGGDAGIRASCMVSDISAIVPAVVDLFDGIESHGVRCQFRDRKGFKVTWESDLVLTPLSPLQIEAPVMRRFSKPDIDYISIKPGGSCGEIVINDMISIDLEFT